MVKFAAMVALAAGLTVSTAASAADVSFRISAGSFSFGSAAVSIDATGTFRTAADDGQFTLGSGLLGFAADGTEDVFEFGGDFRSLSGAFQIGLADLTRFSVTLAGGNVTAISFDAGPVGVPLSNGGELTGESDALTFDVEGVSIFNEDDFTTQDFTSVFSDRYGDQGGSFFVDEVTPGAVPEPASWATMIVGMGAVGWAMRRRARVTARVSYSA